jgi:HK97 family phage portal protein
MVQSFWDKVKTLSTLDKKGFDNFTPINAINSMWGFDSIDGSIKSQQNLIDIGYGQNVTAYSIIKTIAQTGANIPLKLVSINKLGERVAVEKGELFETLKRPATMQGESLSTYDWMEMALTYLLTTGNLYQRGIKATGFGDIWFQLEFLPSGVTAPIVPNSFFATPKGYMVNDMYTDFTVPFDDVLHTRFISPTTYGLNNFLGLSPLQSAVYSLTGSTDIHKAIAVMVKNQGVRGVLTNEGERAMTPEERLLAQSIADSKLSGLSKFNKVMVSNSKMNYLQIGMSATDLKIIESGVLTDRQLANAYGFPSVLLNDPANTSYNNQQTAYKALYTRATIPVVNKVLDDLNNVWLKQWSKRDKVVYELELDTTNIEALQGDLIVDAQKDKVVSDAIVAVLSAPISQESKIQTLIYTHQIDPDVAKLIVGNPIPLPTPVQR